MVKVGADEDSDAPLYCRTVARRFLPRSTYFSPSSFTPTFTSPWSSSAFALVPYMLGFLIDWREFKSSAPTLREQLRCTYSWFRCGLSLLRVDFWPLRGLGLVFFALFVGFNLFLRRTTHWFVRVRLRREVGTCLGLLPAPVCRLDRSLWRRARSNNFLFRVLLPVARSISGLALGHVE